MPGFSAVKDRDGGRTKGGLRYAWANPRGPALSKSRGDLRRNPAQSSQKKKKRRKEEGSFAAEKRKEQAGMAGKRTNVCEATI